jgi:hypothetical protein
MGILEHPDAEKAQEYRRKAIDAAARALACKDESARESWEYIASSYTEMAIRLERQIAGK